MVMQHADAHGDAQHEAHELHEAHEAQEAHVYTTLACVCRSPFKIPDYGLRNYGLRKKEFWRDHFDT